MHIGIVAVSAEGAALCYRTICAEGASHFGLHGHPEVTMHTYPLSEYVRRIAAGRWDEAGELVLASAGILARAGAELLISPDNTIHQAIDLVRHRSPRPWLHIAEEVGIVARERGFRQLGILGTRYLMEGPVYPRALQPLGISSEVPADDQRGRINDVIFDELVYGRVDDASRRYVADVIADLAARGCDAVVLGCTELPLLISDDDSTLALIDSTRTLARAALREAINACQQPSTTND